MASFASSSFCRWSARNWISQSTWGAGSSAAACCIFRFFHMAGFLSLGRLLAISDNCHLALVVELGKLARERGQGDPVLPPDGGGQDGIGFLQLLGLPLLLVANLAQQLRGGPRRPRVRPGPWRHRQGARPRCPC